MAFVARLAALACQVAKLAACRSQAISTFLTRTVLISTTNMRGANVRHSINTAEMLTSAPSTSRFQYTLKQNQPFIGREPVAPRSLLALLRHRKRASLLLQSQLQKPQRRMRARHTYRLATHTRTGTQPRSL